MWDMPDNACKRAVRKIWPQNLWRQAYAVAYKENRSFDPHATYHNTNDTTDIGCFMNNTVHYRDGKWRKQWPGRDAAFDPVINAAIALDIYRGSNNSWTPWCAVKDWYWFGKGCGRR